LPPHIAFLSLPAIHALTLWCHWPPLCSWPPWWTQVAAWKRTRPCGLLATRACHPGHRHSKSMRAGRGVACLILRMEAKEIPPPSCMLRHQTLEVCVYVMCVVYVCMYGGNAYHVKRECFKEHTALETGNLAKLSLSPKTNP
jgi:hypothetical protein